MPCTGSTMKTRDVLAAQRCLERVEIVEWDLREPGQQRPEARR